MARGLEASWVPDLPLASAYSSRSPKPAVNEKIRSAAVLALSQSSSRRFFMRRLFPWTLPSKRIDRVTVHADLKMQMRPGAKTRGPGIPDPLASLDRLPGVNHDIGAVGVQGR